MVICHRAATSCRLKAPEESDAGFLGLWDFRVRFEMRPDEREQCAKARYRYASGMCKYLQEIVLPRLASLLQPTMHQDQLHGYVARATGLMFSVHAMNGVQHFQSIIACN